VLSALHAACCLTHTQAMQDFLADLLTMLIPLRPDTVLSALPAAA
jgi:hypothetical protein